jgi:hypothetical protein
MQSVKLQDVQSQNRKRKRVIVSRVVESTPKTLNDSSSSPFDSVSRSVASSSTIHLASQFLVGLNPAARAKKAHIDTSSSVTQSIQSQSEASFGNSIATSYSVSGGKWPTHVYVEAVLGDHVKYSSIPNAVISASKNVTFQEFYAQVQPIIRSKYASLPIEFLPSPLHMSLSRTVLLKTSEIDLFVRALRLFALECNPIEFTVDSFSIFSNESRSRSFFAFFNHEWLDTLRQEQNERNLKVVLIEKRAHGTKDNVVSFINDLNELMSEFGLPTYYKNIVPHLSFALYRGDLTTNGDLVVADYSDIELTIPTVSQPEEDYNNLYIYGNDLDGIDRLSVPLDTRCTLWFRNIICKVGNRIYECPLYEMQPNSRR